uniref:Large ribosomal subunit protein bL33m n=1 Tax=Tetranychus urticae TaxID=32264 RepID=T1L2L0_TETUR
MAGKSKFIMVCVRSLVSGHPRTAIRPRNAEKLELLRYDPKIQDMAIYVEDKKINSCKY